MAQGTQSDQVAFSDFSLMEPSFYLFVESFFLWKRKSLTSRHLLSMGWNAASLNAYFSKNCCSLHERSAINLLSYSCLVALWNAVIRGAYSLSLLLAGQALGIDRAWSTLLSGHPRVYSNSSFQNGEHDHKMACGTQGRKVSKLLHNHRLS